MLIRSFIAVSSALATWWTYPRTNKGMAQSPADKRKTKPGNHATVAAYTLLKTAPATLVVKLSRKERQANRAPAKPHKGEKNCDKVTNNRTRLKSGWFQDSPLLYWDSFHFFFHLLVRISQPPTQKLNYWHSAEKSNWTVQQTVVTEIRIH